jgi:hypothetical protein
MSAIAGATGRCKDLLPVVELIGSFLLRGTSFIISIKFLYQKLAYPDSDYKVFQKFVSEAEAIQKQQNLTGLAVSIKTFAKLFKPVFSCFNIDFDSEGEANLFYKGIY